MPASKFTNPDAKTLHKDDVAHFMKKTAKDSTPKIIVADPKAKPLAVSKQAKKLKKQNANNSKRFTFAKIVDITTVEEYKKQIGNAMAIFENDAFKKDTPVLDWAYVSSFWSSNQHTGSGDIAGKLFLDPNDIMEACTNVRNLLVGMTFSLGILTGNTKEYDSLVPDTFAAMSNHLLEYISNWTSSLEPLAYMAEKRNQKKGSCSSFTSCKRRVQISINAVTENVDAIQAHLKVMTQVAKLQNSEGFAAAMKVAAKAGIRHGTTVANSYKKTMNKMMDRFDVVVATMNEKFNAEIKATNAKWKLKYEAMETRLLKEIGRLEDVSSKSQALNKKYESSLSDLVGRMEKLNSLNPADKVLAATLKVKSGSLFESNDRESENFKENTLGKVHNKEALIGKKPFLQTTMGKVAVGGGIATVVVASSLAFMLRQKDTKKGRNR